ncbi:hypothetical protein E6C27_scaffold319G00490 [Cucumis melo var. makuwa]|uniref:Uncharacterized protein n=1 Tax=Cucumis melo var. makuwa TaxID=1194695 RepID=A0A5A7UR21_CUCMM|nr:hypothetical protein E6C27_scaffold319G00490 [Cucumis melo var. makuwa]
MKTSKSIKGTNERRDDLDGIALNMCLNAVDDGVSELLALEGDEGNKRKSVAMACVSWFIQLCSAATAAAPSPPSTRSLPCAATPSPSSTRSLPCAASILRSPAVDLPCHRRSRPNRNSSPFVSSHHPHRSASCRVSVSTSPQVIDRWLAITIVARCRQQAPPSVAYPADHSRAKRMPDSCLQSLCTVNRLDPRLLREPNASRACACSQPSCACLISRAASTISGAVKLFLSHKPILGFSTYLGLKRCNVDLGTSLLGKRDFAVRTGLSKSPVRQNRQSGIDIDMIQVIRWDRSQPDCLSVSSGCTTDQFVRGVPLGSPKTSYVPPGSHVARVRERVSSWIPLSGL